MDIPNLKTMKVTTSTGKDVTDTDMLKGEAKNSLSGTNETVQYVNGGGCSGDGPWGGLNKN